MNDIDFGINARFNLIETKLDTDVGCQIADVSTESSTIELALQNAKGTTLGDTVKIELDPDGHFVANEAKTSSGVSTITNTVGENGASLMWKSSEDEYNRGAITINDPTLEDNGIYAQIYATESLKKGTYLDITPENFYLVNKEDGYLSPDKRHDSKYALVRQKEISTITTDISTVKSQISTINTQIATINSTLNNKQDNLTAGEGISIVDNVISCTGGGGDVTKEYVDTQDSSVLETANTNANTNIDKAKQEIEAELTKKLDCLGNEAESGEPYKMIYYVREPERKEDGWTITVDNITMDNNKTLGNASRDIPCAQNTDTSHVAGLMSYADKARLDTIYQMLTDRYNDPTKEEYETLNIPYYYKVNVGQTAITVTDYTVAINKDGEIEKKTFSMEIPRATTATAGLMSADDYTILHKSAEIHESFEKNHVNLSDTQSIGGTKTFLNEIIAANGIKNSSSDTGGYIAFKNGQIVHKGSEDSAVCTYNLPTCDTSMTVELAVKREILDSPDSSDWDAGIFSGVIDSLGLAKLNAGDCTLKIPVVIDGKTYTTYFKDFVYYKDTGANTCRTYTHLFSTNLINIDVNLKTGAYNGTITKLA